MTSRIGHCTYAKTIKSHLLFTTNYRDVEGAFREPFRQLWKRPKRGKSKDYAAKTIARAIKSYKLNPKKNGPATVEETISVLGNLIESIEYVIQGRCGGVSISRYAHQSGRIRTKYHRRCFNAVKNKIARNEE